MNPANMTEHQSRIADFMKLAGQALPEKTTLPSKEIRELRARLILEEALETIDALGFCAEIEIMPVPQKMRSPIIVAHDRGPNLREVADGCADISVVTIGTLLAFGIADKPLLEEVDRSNLAKFDLPKCTVHPDMPMDHLADGNYRCFNETNSYRCAYHARGPYRRDDGKWIKGPDWKEPDINGAIFQSCAPANLKSWTPEQFDEAKDQLVAFQEFKAAEELVKVIRRMRGAVPCEEWEANAAKVSEIAPIQHDMPRENKTPHCSHCRGILSTKLIENMIERQTSLPCPNCLQLLDLISVIYA